MIRAFIVKCSFSPTNYKFCNRLVQKWFDWMLCNKSIRKNKKVNCVYQYNLFIFRILFYFAFGAGSHGFRSPTSAPRHKKKKAFGRPSKSAESLCFKPFSALLCARYCIKVRRKISIKPARQSDRSLWKFARSSFVPVSASSAYTPAYCHPSWT